MSCRKGCLLRGRMDEGEKKTQLCRDCEGFKAFRYLQIDICLFVYTDFSLLCKGIKKNQLGTEEEEKGEWKLADDKNSIHPFLIPGCSWTYSCGGLLEPVSPNVIGRPWWHHGHVTSITKSKFWKYAFTIKKLSQRTFYLKVSWKQMLHIYTSC